MNHRLKIIISTLLLGACAPACAATNREGMNTAAGAALPRADGAVLVEVEGFTDPEGDIPCVGKSFSNIWHYKFYAKASGAWLIVNACADNFINASKHLPTDRAEEPTTALPAYFADSRTVLEKLKKENIFSGTGTAKSRDILMKARFLPAKDGRPAGCYWTVSQGKTTIFADCDGKKHWGGEAGSAAAPKLAPGKIMKGTDTAGRYAKTAVAAMRRKQQASGQREAQLMYLEALADKNGNAKCITADDGWAYNFSNGMSFGGCKGKTVLQEFDYDGRTGGKAKGYNPLPPTFKDSDYVIAKTPAACAGAHSTISMKLQNFKPELSPAAGHTLIWTVACGSLKYYLDGYTGVYIGPGKK